MGFISPINRCVVSDLRITVYFVVIFGTSKTLYIRQLLQYISHNEAQNLNLFTFSSKISSFLSLSAFKSVFAIIKFNWPGN